MQILTGTKFLMSLVAAIRIDSHPVPVIVELTLREMLLRRVNAKGLFDMYLKSTHIRCAALVGDGSDANRNTRSG
jgi:hypothetical protein